MRRAPTGALFFCPRGRKAQASQSAGGCAVGAPSPAWGGGTTGRRGGWGEPHPPIYTLQDDDRPAAALVLVGIDPVRAAFTALRQAAAVAAVAGGRALVLTRVPR